MLAVKDFLNNMAKPQLKELHAKAFGSKGLLNNAKILSETLEFFADSARFEKFYASLEPWKRLCLFLVYHSETRGLEINELRLAAPANKRDEVEPFLLESAKELYLWRSKTEKGSYVYLGFDDFLKSVLLATEECAPDEKMRFFSYEDMLVWHLSLVLSFVRLGKMKMNGTGNLHRRSIQFCEEAFRYSKPLSAEASREEIVLLMEFLSSSGWIEQRGMDLNVTDVALDFLKHNGFRLKNEILEWWIKRRFHGANDFFKHALFSIKRNVSAIHAERIFWTLDPTFRMPSADDVCWSVLPKPLAELWLLGMLEFSVHSGKIVAVRLSSWAQEWLSAGATPMLGAQISTLPNFEMVISVKSAPRVLFMSACLADVQNDEPYLRFAVSRDSFLNGLKTGFSKDSVESFEGWISAPANVLEAMREWEACYYDSAFSTVRILKIDRAEIREALEKFAQFMEMVEEAIPGYGFIVKPEFEAKIRDLLKHYGLEPAVSASAVPVEPFHNADWSKAFWLRWPQNGEPDSLFKPEIDGTSVSVALETTKYGGDFQKFAMVDLFKVLRYARSTGGSLEAKLSKKEVKNVKLPKLPGEIRFKVESLHFSKVPFIARIVLEPGEKVLELPLESIAELRMART